MYSIEHYLHEAYRFATYFSTDPSTQNGAVLLDEDGTIIVSAANHFPSGVMESKERWERPLKYAFVEHAERNLIYKAAKLGIKTNGKMMVCPWFACADCARAIVQAGIGCIIGHDSQLPIDTRWKQSIAIGDIILKEGGVIFSRVKASFPDIKFRYNGELVSP